MADYSPGNTKLRNLNKKFEDLNTLMIAVVIVLLVGFGTMFITVYSVFRDNEAEKQATFQNLTNQVQTQNTQIQVLTNQLKNSTVTPK